MTTTQATTNLKQNLMKNFNALKAWIEEMKMVNEMLKEDISLQKWMAGTKTQIKQINQQSSSHFYTLKDLYVE